MLLKAMHLDIDYFYGNQYIERDNKGMLIRSNIASGNLQRAKMTKLPAKERELLELQEKILKAKSKGKGKTTPTLGHKNVSYVWRMVLELVIGMVLGFGIGYGLDQWLNTAPLMIVIMSLFGFGAGIRTMMRTAAEFADFESEPNLKEQ